jgi:hypothetical protein
VEAAPDLSAVQEPKDLLLVGRWNRPAKSVDQVLKAFGVPFSIQTLLEKEAPEVAELAHLDASIDVAVALDPDSTDDNPKLLAAASIPLRSFEAAKAAGEKEGKLTRIAPGVFREEGKKWEKSVCDLAAAAGDAPARLVCGERARDTDTLRPWLVRGLPRTAPSTDEMLVTLRAAPLRERYLGPLRAKAAALSDEARADLTGRNISDPDLLTAPGMILDEGLRFVEDLDEILVRVSFTPSPPEVVAGGTLRFGGRSAWLTRLITDKNDKAGPPPALFWRAPRDATSATWGKGNDSRLFDGVRKVLRKALVEGLAQTPLPEADRAALVAFVDGLPLSSGAWVSARGLVPAKPKPAVKSAPPKGAASPLDLSAITRAAVGWTIAGVEAPAGEWVAWAKQGVDVYARALRLLHDFAKVSNVAAKEMHFLDVMPRVRVTTSPPGWPKGTVAFDVTVSAELPMLLLSHNKGEGEAKTRPAAKGTITLRLAIVPDGDRTWLGLSADLDDLKKRMTAIASGAPKEGTLAAREGLDALRAPGQTWGGFFSVGETIERAVESLETEKPDDASHARAALAALPNHGRTPILLLGGGTSGDKPSSTAEVRLEAGTLADIAALAIFLASPRGRELLKKL